MHVALGFLGLRFSIPLGAAYVAGALRAAGHRVSLFVADRRGAQLFERLASDPPDLVAYGPMSGDHAGYLALHARLRRRLAVPSVWGGPHATFFPDLIRREGVDAVCLGEAEEAMVEFVDRYARDGAWPTDVRNFWVKGPDGTIHRNPVRPLIRDLDGLPHPARDLFLEAHPILHQHGIKHFIANRGCPFKCTYCFNQSLHRLYGRDEPLVRSRDPEEVCDEILEVRRATLLEMVAFVDDSFTLDVDWLRRFAEVYKRRVGLPYSCNLRLDYCTPEVADLLADSGCALAFVGIESGDAEVRRRLLGRRMSNETIRTSVGLLHVRGLRTIAENMIGLPGESFEQALRTLRLNMELRPTLANASLFTPYPDLPLTRYAIRHGHFAGGVDDLGTNYYHHSLMRYPSRDARNRMVNVRCFFSFLARHPRFWPWLRPLLRLPPNALFRLFGDLMDGHYLSRCTAYRMPIWRLVRILLHYLRAYR
ncbi:MAG: radical SAM protein [Candidatus Eisenbacteria bacterium]|nr:radical SAM protein [Candidatus Eisenbacteria bacterium]